MRSSPAVSVVIRTRQEERFLNALIARLRQQTVPNVEIVLVVDYSDVETLNRVNMLPVNRVVPIAHEDFNHARSTNLGVAATASEFVAITNGHTLPMSSDWLEAGMKHFADPRVAGVTGLSVPFEDGSVWEKLYFSPIRLTLYGKKGLQPILGLVGPHFFSISTINCMLRRSLWEAYPFDESLPQCEDYDWGVEMHSRGYLTRVEPAFSVYHSHGESLRVFLSRVLHWELSTRNLNARNRPRTSFIRDDAYVNILKLTSLELAQS